MKAAATFTGVRKIAMPVTRLTTIIVKSKRLHCFQPYTLRIGKTF